MLAKYGRSIFNSTAFHSKVQNSYLAWYSNFKALSRNALNEDSNQSTHSHSLISICICLSFPPSLATHRVHIEDFDQTAQMRRLIRVLNGHTCQLVLFAGHWLKMCPLLIKTV